MAITFDNVSMQGATAYGAVANTSASNASSQTSGSSQSSSPTPAPSPASYAAFASDTLSALIASQADDGGETYYPPAPTPPPPPPGTVSSTQTMTAAPAATPETKLTQVLDNIRASAANTTPAPDASRPFSQRESARSTVQTGVSQTQAQTMQRIASSQAGIAILQVATVAAAFNAQFSASGFNNTFNNGFSTGFGGNTVSRFSSSFAFQQNRLF